MNDFRDNRWRLRTGGCFRHIPDVDLVLDLRLPDLDRLDVLATILERHPATPVVLLSGEEDQAVMRHALDSGAQDFIPKSEKREVLSSALALIRAGGVGWLGEVRTA